MPEMEDSRPHLELRREEPVVERRPRRGFAGVSPLGDPRGHGAALGERPQSARRMAETDVGGYDQRRLIKITLTDKVQPEQIAQASAGVEIVSQEEGTLLLAFATEQQLEDFEAKLARLAVGQRATYQNVLYALQDLDHWSPEDRAGWALRRDGFPDTELFAIDVELWPLARGIDMDRMRRAFETWIGGRGGEVLDAVRQPCPLIRTPLRGSRNALQGAASRKRFGRAARSRLRRGDSRSPRGRCASVRGSLW